MEGKREVIGFGEIKTSSVHSIHLARQEIKQGSRPTQLSPLKSFASLKEPTRPVTPVLFNKPLFSLAENGSSRPSTAAALKK
jgi:hypothetical protein